jgi:hypothetical protein
LASPITAWLTLWSLSSVVPSDTTWTIVLPAGIGKENEPFEKLQPTPNTRSDLTRKCAAASDIEWPPAPSASG